MTVLVAVAAAPEWVSLRLVGYVGYQTSAATTAPPVRAARSRAAGSPVSLGRTHYQKTTELTITPAFRWLPTGRI